MIAIDVIGRQNVDRFKTFPDLFKTLNLTQDGKRK